MDGTVCPQCRKVLNGAAVRLVQDACGHKKCRICLLQDDEKCGQCNATETRKTIINKCENNHTAVITCNNNIKHSNTILVNNNVKPANKPAESEINLTSRLIKDRKKISETIKAANKIINNFNSRKSISSDDSKKTEKKKRSYKPLLIPNHISFLKNPTMYKCNVCDKTFVTRSHIKYHLYCNGGQKPYRCGECAKEFVSKSLLEVHSLVHNDLKLYSCRVCHKSFRLKSKLNRHELLHSAAKPYQCQECGKAFKTKEYLSIHLLTHDTKKKYECKLCKKRFSNSSNLKKHLASHSKAKAYMCEQCGKFFKRKWSVTVHRRMHLVARPHVCLNCPKAFANAKDLQRHQLIHLDEKGYRCGRCQSEFRRKDNLKRHIKYSHPGETVEMIRNHVKPLVTKVKTHVPSVVDNPNAINVITASPCVPLNKYPKAEAKPIINGPLKLAFKTTAFKSNYNIQRAPPDISDSFNIYNNILSTSTPKNGSPVTPPRNVIQKLTKVNEKTYNSETTQRTYASSLDLNYKASLECIPPGTFKNIKFKLPPYMNPPPPKTSEAPNDLKPLKPVNNANVNPNELKDSSKNTYHTLMPVATVTTNAAITSVIVNSNCNHNNNNQQQNQPTSQQQQSEMHWRRRTLQNLNLQLKN